ncbi:MAG: winged helix-turn-helix transcriptional regulator [Candidatus Dormibacteria bacterium]
MDKTYGQYCGLARALDIVGDRWTLLIVRELLVGEAAYGGLQDGLPGIATNLLVERLRALEAHDIVERSGARKATRYRLTKRGRDLQGAVHSLVRWGAPEMIRGPQRDVVRPAWLVVALGALAVPTGIDATIGFRVGDAVVTVNTRSAVSFLGNEVTVADVMVTTDVATALGLATGALSVRSAVRSGRAAVQGGQLRAQTLLTALAGRSRRTSRLDE